MIALVGCAVATATLFTIYFKMGEVNEMSKALINSWRKSPMPSFSPADKSLFQKYIKSCRPLRLDVGAFGYYNRPLSIRIVGKVVVYAVKFLIIMNKIV